MGFRVKDFGFRVEGVGCIRFVVGVERFGGGGWAVMGCGGTARQAIRREIRRALKMRMDDSLIFYSKAGASYMRPICVLNVSYARNRKSI